MRVGQLKLVMANGEPEERVGVVSRIGFRDLAYCE